ncbi:MAG TPA: sulfite exporter TauE/SafE family protein [Burkholderiales bacterium]|nr:sulfite exporter TauE/SafE family protein [Burkholderiales bacterium]
MIEQLTLLQMLWIGTAVLAAYIVRGMSGFGAGLVAAPLLAFVLPVHVVIPTAGLLVFILFIFLTIRDRRSVNWRELKLLAPPTIAGVIAGLVLFTMLDNRLLLIMLGGFLVLYAVYMLAVHAFGLPQFKCSERWAIPLGFAGSFFDTLFGGGGGTLVVIYVHARGLGRMEFRATLAMLWFLEMIARISGYAISGFYTREVLMLVAALLPITWAGTWIGERLGNRVSQVAFSRILAAVLLLSGVSLMFK